MKALKSLELSRQERQAELDEERSQGERNKLGQFATPELLAVEMAELARQLWTPRAPVRFLDPAIGSGSFYSALRRAFPTVQTSAGVEIDPRFVRAARSLWKESGLEVREGDFTRLEPPKSKRATLVLANPPYVRHHHLAGDEKDRLQKAVAETLGLKISGLAGLYAYFLLLAHRWMEPGALALWLVPSEFMDVNYGGTVRKYLRNHVTLLRLHRFDPSDVQFSDALVSSAVLVFRASPPPKDHEVHFTYGGSLTTPRQREAVPLRKLSASEKWSGFAVGGRDRSLPSGPRLGDYFAVKRGIATGANEFFVLPRPRARDLSIPERYLRPILPSPRYLKETVIEAEADGYPALADQLVLIDSDSTPETLQAEAPGLFAYLESASQSGVRDRYLVTKRAPWYRQEQRAPAPFFCTYMGRGVGEKSPFRFIWNKSNAIAANVYLLLYPIGEMRAALDDDPKLYAALFDLFSSIDAEALRGEGRVYGGALHKLEPKELGQLPADAFAALIPPRLQRARQESLFAAQEV